MNRDIILDTGENWMSVSGPENNIVLTSRVRLARNIAKMPFPNWADENKRVEILNVVKKAFKEGDLSNFKVYKLDDISDIDKMYLSEEYLISHDFLEPRVGRAIALRDDRHVCVMINEEDHMRIQCILPGLNIKKCYQETFGVEQLLEQGMEFAFSEKIGFLTACPTNVGTALRASALLHLPAMVISQKMNNLTTMLMKVGVVVRGAFGEGTNVAGNLFQVSNHITLGKSEDEILENINSIILNIVEKEKNTRSLLLSESKEKIMDNASRAYGILTHAITLTYEEAIELLSMIRMGSDLGLITLTPDLNFNEIMISIRSSHIAKIAGSKLSDGEECSARADFIRSKLELNKIH
ncbi:MAG: protein arginine kinase [Omnitrophica WOR_2 bacterium RBG_13_44_8]|nr:MAG: protein arginine kinase [Omnitrophica WOR_2 bacterium RBG_13_44_8]